ncbi:MAG: D-mannonate dehydratase [Oscillospiraceae bacterium]|nr:D-mannonate dehydratase [Oscillospiraceae bacterium]
MLELEVIQYRGFHNLYDEDGNAIGFQVCVRSDYYKGIWLSQLRPGRVIVDGELFPWNTIIWNIDGVDYTTDELAERSDKFWRNSDVATLKVMKPGGLAQGFHDVTVRFYASASYLAPSSEMDDNSEFNIFYGGTYTRNHMVIV